MQSIIESIAPWTAAAFAIVAAVSAERAFHTSAQGATPDRWPGADTESFFNDFDDTGEIAQRTMRDCARSEASGWQSISTYLAAGAAVEAAAASQRGPEAIILFAIGVAGVIIAASIRAHRIRDDILYTRAWYKRLRWSEKRKYVHSGDFEEEDRIFAHEFPREGAILQRREGPRQPIDIPPQIPPA